MQGNDVANYGTWGTDGGAVHTLGFCHDCVMDRNCSTTRPRHTFDFSVHSLPSLHRSRQLETFIAGIDLHFRIDVLVHSEWLVLHRRLGSGAATAMNDVSGENERPKCAYHRSCKRSPVVARFSRVHRGSIRVTIGASDVFPLALAPAAAADRPAFPIRAVAIFKTDGSLRAGSNNASER